VTTRRPAISRSVGLFGDADPDRKPLAAHQASIDGGSRGNPGPAAYGVVVRDAGGEIVARLKKYIGQNTNNVAEYFGLIAALDYAEAHNIRALRVQSDSELMVKQMRGQYKVKSEELRPLFERAKKMVGSLEMFRIDHVYREQNREADALVNQALDETSRGGSASASASGSASTEKRAAAAPAKDQTMKILARYEDGQLRPYAALDLPEGTEVELVLRLKR
jgi:ribonuclease HI